MDSRRTSFGLLAALLALAVLVAGCGGGSTPSPEEAQLLARLKRAREKTAAARSLVVTELIEGEANRGSRELQPVTCLQVGVDKRPPDTAYLQAHETDCQGVPTGVELRSIGDRIWATAAPREWREMTAGRELITEVFDFEKPFLGVIEEADDVREVGDGRYAFTAPLSIYKEALGEGAAPDEVTYEATVDDSGHLTSLKFIGTRDGVKSVVTATYGRFGAPQRIDAPRPGEVVAHPGEIGDKKGLEEAIKSSIG